MIKLYINLYISVNYGDESSDDEILNTARVNNYNNNGGILNQFSAYSKESSL